MEKKKENTKAVKENTKKTAAKKTVKKTTVKKDDKKVLAKSVEPKKTKAKKEVKKEALVKAADTKLIEKDLKPVVSKEIKVEETKSVETTKPTKKVNVYLVIAIIALVASICLLAKDYFKKNTYKLGEYLGYYAETEITITLPGNWYLLDDCSIYEANGSKLDYKGFIYVAEVPEDEFNAVIDEYKTQQEMGYFSLEETTLNGLNCYKMNQEAEDGYYDVYLLYSDGAVTELLLMNSDIDTANSIYSSIK